VHVINKREEQREEREKEKKKKRLREECNVENTIIISFFCYDNTGYTFSSTKSEYKIVKELGVECGNN
jgi:hypothetical protein